VIYLSMIAVTSLAIGVCVDAVYEFMGIRASAVVGQAGEIVPYGVQMASAVLLTGLMAYNGWKHSPHGASRICSHDSCG
jgi:hypothetical protein